MSKQPPPAPTASAVGPCPTLTQTGRTPRHWKFTQHYRTTRPPPFVIQKVLQSIAGELKNIKKLARSNQLLIEVNKKSHAENLLRTQKFHNLNVRVYPHSSLNSSRGVIRSPDLRECSEQEILDEMKSQGVTAVKRFRF